MATNRAPEIDGVAALFLTLTWITSALRCYVKGFMAKSFGIEDWLAMLAQALFTLTACFALEGISHSMGKHLLEIPLQDLAPAMMYWFSVELAYTITTGVLKLSIAFFLLRIATNKSHRIILYSIIVLVSLLTVAYFLFLVFQCKPVSYFWLQFDGETGSCLAPAVVGDMTYAHSGINAFCDVILALLPVVIVSRLQMNIRTKLTVSTILSMGIIAAIAVIIRIPYVKVLVGNASDFLYSSTDVVIWSTIEPGLAITAANMATLRPLFQVFLSRTKLWGSTTAHGKSSGYGHSRSRTRSRGLSGNRIPGRKGYIRSGSKGHITLQMDTEGDEMRLKDMISSTADSGNEKAGRGRWTTITTTTISNGKNDSLRSVGGVEDWDLERGIERGERRRQERNGSVSQAIGEWPINATKTVQTNVTSWRVEEDIIPVGMTIQGGNGARRQSNSHTHIGATGAGW